MQAGPFPEEEGACGPEACALQQDTTLSCSPASGNSQLHSAHRALGSAALMLRGDENGEHLPVVPSLLVPFTAPLGVAAAFAVLGI